MRASVLHFHPVPESFSAAVLDAANAALADGGHDVDIHRLHAGDDPSADEVGAAHALVLVYPTWWGGQPAALLDWVQRRLGPWIDGDGVARGTAPPGPSPLAGVRHLIAVTTHGSSQLVNRLQGEPGRQLVTRVLPGVCAPDVDVRWISLYKCDRTTGAERRAFLERVGREVSLDSPATQPAPDR